jgi:hypothetical protein
MDTVAAELMEWGDPSVEDLEGFDREVRSEEHPISDRPTEQIPPQSHGMSPASCEDILCLRRALAVPLKGDPLRGVSP